MLLETAPDEIKLAVDLIQLLEESNLPTTTILAALVIVQRDYEQKQTYESYIYKIGDKLQHI